MNKFKAYMLAIGIVLSLLIGMTSFIYGIIGGVIWLNNHNPELLLCIVGYGFLSFVILVVVVALAQFIESE
jgi:hypothetical protein